MSDFDKEAEREKLREKYGDDENDRAATEQMSELLLKGATMTNAHCNNCGDPIFRYDGQEFCPSCQRPVDRGDSGEASGDDTEAGDNIEMTTPSDEATVQFGDDDAATAGGTNQTDQPTGQSAEPTESAPSRRPSEQSERAPSRADAAPSTDRAAGQPRSAPSIDPAATESPAHDVEQQTTDTNGAAPSTAGAASSHLTNAQVVLAQTVEQFAQRARETDSPQQAKAYLEAAREAAETLDETGF